MKTATSLALVAIGAILAFAITRSPSFLNLQVVGWVLMLTGAVGAIIPRRGYGWLRRSLVVDNDEVDETGAVVETETTEPVAINPADNPRFSRLLVPGRLISSRRGLAQPAGEVKRETIEEYIEE
jgi:hypothetical protein